MREFYLFDREQEPETSARRQVIEFINARPGCFAALTTKRTVENYLHPLAIREACGIDLIFDDDTDVAGLLALKLMARRGETSWRQLPYKRQRRLHERAKKILNMKAVQQMTPALLAQQDPHGEVAGWLRMIRQMVEEGHHQLDSLDPIREESIMPVTFTDRELATSSRHSGTGSMTWPKTKTDPSQTTSRIARLCPSMRSTICANASIAAHPQIRLAKSTAKTPHNP